MQESSPKPKQSIKINIAIPMPESHPEKTAPKSTCTNCSSCENCKQVSECGPLLQHAAKILTNMFSGVYRQDQISDALKWVDELLRRHYSKKQ